MTSWWKLIAQQLGASSGAGSWRKRAAAELGALAGKQGGAAGRHLLDSLGAQQEVGSWDRRITPVADSEGVGSWARRLFASGFLFGPTVRLSSDLIFEGADEDTEIGVFTVNNPPEGATHVTVLVNDDAGGQVKLGTPDGFTVPLLAGATPTDYEGDPSPAYQFTFQCRDAGSDPVGDPIVVSGEITVVDRPDLVVTPLALTNASPVGTPAWTAEIVYSGVVTGTPEYSLLSGVDAPKYAADPATGDGEVADTLAVGTDDLTLAVAGISPAPAASAVAFQLTITAAVVIGAPTISTPAGVLPSDNTPDVEVDPTATGAQDGDTIRYQIRPLDGPGGAPTGDWEDYVLDVWPDVSEPFTVEGATILADGYYLRRFRFERGATLGDWSNEQEFRVDTTAPSVVLRSPADDEIDVASYIGVLMEQFDEPIQFAAGVDIRIYQASDDLLVAAYDAADIGAGISMGAGIAIDADTLLIAAPELTPGETYYVIRSGIEDLAGNPAEDVATSPAWNFTVAGEQAPFSPADLFAGGEDGIWIDPSDLATMWQDAAGTIPVTSNNDRVGRIVDKVNGIVFTQPTDANRPTYQTSGGLHWLDFSGSNWLTATAGAAMTNGSGEHSSACAFRTDTLSGVAQIYSQDGGTSPRIAQFLRRNAAAFEAIAFNTTPSAFTDGAGATLSTGVDYVGSQVTAGAAIEGFIGGSGNGSTAITGTKATGATLAPRVGASASAAVNERFDGRLYQLVHVGRGITAGERTNLESFCSAKAGL